MWLTGRLVPDHKIIADFRRDNGQAIRKTCAQFVELCRRIGVLRGDCVAIDGSKFKAVNNRDKNFTKGKIANAGSGAGGASEPGLRVNLLQGLLRDQVGAADRVPGDARPKS